MPRKPKITQPQIPNVVQGRDLFSTPRYAVELLIPFIPSSVKSVWECAAGDHRITNVLEQWGYTVFSSDIRGENSIMNFLECNKTYGDVIITNPPFSIKKQFVAKCLTLSVPFALLVPADYCGWMIDCIKFWGCEKIIPTRRIDYITPSGNSGKRSTSQFHSIWLTRFFELGKSENFVDLSLKEKENI